MLSVLGEHKRMGALDVCPYIPVQGVTMEDCVQCAKMFGERAAVELGIPGIYKMKQCLLNTCTICA